MVAVFESARIALGGVAPTPLFVPEAGEALKGQQVAITAIEQAAQIARQAARPISDIARQPRPAQPPLRCSGEAFPGTRHPARQSRAEKESSCLIE